MPGAQVAALRAHTLTPSSIPFVDQCRDTPADVAATVAHGGPGPPTMAIDADGQPRPFRLWEGYLVREGLISLPEASEHLPPVHGKRISVNALWRWIVYGKRGVHLEAVQCVGNQWWTTVLALERFALALTAKKIRHVPRRGTPRPLEQRT